MVRRTKVAKARGTGATVLVSSLLVLLVLSLTVVLSGGPAEALPELSVSKPNGDVLLGGNASVNITITNTGDERGYNLSVSDTFSSLPVGGKSVSFVSASGPDGPLTPSSVTTDPVSGDVTVTFDDIRDLVPTEAATITIVMDLDDPTWAVGDILHDEVTAEVNTQPDGSGAAIQGSDTGDFTLIPITVVTKSANQSTADGQATGCGELPSGTWPYSYTIEVQNNYVNPSDNVRVTDYLPDGIEYLGMLVGPVPDSVTRDPVTGITTLDWTSIGTLGAGATWTAQYQSGIRYDYYGTGNGGTNRPYNDYAWPGGLGTPLPDHVALPNTADLYSEYFGVPYTDSDSASVDGGYAALSKGAAPGTVGIGDTVTFTITYCSSEYYNLDNLVVTDVVPDGLTYTGGSAVPPPDLIQNDTPGLGETTLTWNTLPPLPSGTSATIAFDTTVDATWSVPPDPEHTWIVAGDSMTNDVQLDGDWHDEVDLLRVGSTHQSSSASTVTEGPMPIIIKEVAPDVAGVPGTYSHTESATVGDILWFRVRLNTNDGANPITDNVQFGNVDVIDWIPRGTAYVNGSSTMTYSDAGDFHYDPPTPKFSARYNDQPQQIYSGALDGCAWSLGNMEPDGWWQVELQIVVQDDAAVTDGVLVHNFGKCDGENSLSNQYSERDIADITYTEPNLTIDKAVTGTPTPFGANSTVDYRVTLVNDGTAPAQNVLIVDTLADGMRDYDPTTGPVAVTLGGVVLTDTVDYELSYNGGTGQFSVDLQTATVSTPIPIGPPPANTLTVDYQARVDNDVGAGRSLTNNASATWSSQPSGTPNRDYGPVSDNANVALPYLGIAKEIVAPVSETVAIGENVTYRLTVTVPAGNMAYNGQVRDEIFAHGLEYVASTTQLSDVSGSPPGPALFSDGTQTMDPAEFYYAGTNPAARFNWGMQSPIDNRGQATDYVFQVEFQVQATGLITPVSQGGSADNPANWNWWPNTGGDPTADNQASDRGRMLWSDGSIWRTDYSNNKSTHVHQPYLVLDKSNDHPLPLTVEGGDPVNYTITIVNAGRTTAFDNMVVDTLADGMRTNPPVVTGVTLDAAPLTPGTDYSYNYVGATGVQTFNFDGGTSDTDINSASVLVITYTATVDEDVGSGALLTNNAYVEYCSLDGVPVGSRHVENGDDSSGSNTDDSVVQTRSATMAKTIVPPPPPNSVIIGDDVTYVLTVTVPENTVMYNNHLIDTIFQDGMEYVPGTSSLHWVSGSPQTAASFSGSADPTEDYNNPSPGATFTWDLNDIDNAGAGVVGDYVFYLQFDLKATGLILPTGSMSNPIDWVWWIPGADTAVDRGTVAWNDGSQDRTADSTDETTDIQQPFLVMDKTNNAVGTVAGGSTIDYTLTVTNMHNSTAYKNIVVDTLDAGMRDTDPQGTVAVTLNAIPLTPGGDFTTGWNGGTGELTIDLDMGVSQTDIATAGILVVTYTGTVDADVGAGSQLRNVASVEYNSQGDGSGRQVQLTTNTGDANTDDSTADVPDATIAKSQDATANQATIGEHFTYTIDVMVPANTSIYDSTVNDTIPDGLTVDGTSTYLDGTPQVIGSVTVGPEVLGATPVDWDIWDTVIGVWTNGTAVDQVLTLEIDVHVDDTYHTGTPVSGLPPQDTFQNTAFLTWFEQPAANPHFEQDSATPVTAVEPYLVLGMTNDAVGPVNGGDTVGYTITVDNTGTSISNKNVVVSTLPTGMRGNAPTSIVVRLNGALQNLGTDYTISWNGTTGELTIDLDMGASQTNIPVGWPLVITYDATIDSPSGSGSVLTSIASVEYNSMTDGTGRQTARTSNPADHNTDDSSVDVESATIVKTHDAAGNIATIGFPYTYTVSVTVPAMETIYNAQMTDTVPDGLTVTGASTATGSIAYVAMPNGTTDVTWDIGDYNNPTGSAVIITADIAVRVDDQYNGGANVQQGDIFSNTADIAWDDAETGGTTHNDSGSAPDVTIREPSLSVNKFVSDPNPEAGDTLTYSIQVTNNGNWNAYEVSVNDSIDSRLTYVPGSITGPGHDASGDPDLTWDVQAGHGPIIPSETVTLTYQATVNGGVAQGVVINNTATLPSYSGLPQPDPFARTYGPISDPESVTTRAATLSVAKTVLVNPSPSWGETVTYQVTVTNTGDATAYNVDVSDTIPSPHFSYVNGTTSATWPSGTSTADPAGAPGPGLAWDLNADLAPTETLTLTFDMLVEQWAAHGVHTNTGYGDGEDGAGSPLPQDSDTADIDVHQEFGVNITKTLEDWDGFVPIGDEFDYTIVVTNVGNTTIPVVPLDDTYDQAYLEYVSATPVPDTVVAGSLTWNDISGGTGLTPNQSASVTVTFKALQVGVTPETDDTASIGPGTVDDQGNPITGSDTNTSLTITDPGMVVTKTLDDTDGFVPVGADFNYTIRIENVGDTALVVPVILQDRFDPEYMTFKSATPAPDTADPGDLLWVDASGGAGIASGAHVDVIVTYTAMKPGKTPETDNRVEVFALDEHDDPVAGADTNTTLTITNPELTVEKGLAEGQKEKVKFGADVKFEIVVTNSGDTIIPAPVPLTDTYDGDYFRFEKAGLEPCSVSSGKLEWTDITAGNGLAPGDKVTIELVLKALRKGGPPDTTDTATVAGVTDEHGDPVPDASDTQWVSVGEAKILGDTDWFLAEGSTGGGFDTWILLQNPLKQEANVDVTFTTHDGPRAPLEIVIEPESRYTIRIQDFVPDDFHVSTIVKSDIPVVAERSMYWDRRYWAETTVPGDPEPYEMKGGHSTLGVPMSAREAEAGADAGQTIYFPEGATGGGFDLWILLCNPGSEEATVDVNLMTPAGLIPATTVTVHPESRQTVHIDDYLPNADQVATEITADVPIIAERSLYWDPNGEALQPYEMRGGHSGPGSSSPDTAWFMAEGSTGWGFETYILIQNPGDEEAEVTATFLNEEGPAAEKTITMAAKTRATLRISDYVFGDFHVATEVTSDKEIVATRSMYWDKRQTKDIVCMRDGHSNIGSVLTGTIWMVPEGSTGGGFDSWVLISNPQETDIEVELTFMTHAGPLDPVAVTIPAKSRYTVRVSDYVPDDFHVSTLAESVDEMVVERAMYWDRREWSGIQPYEMMGGHSASGVDP